ncbi:MAG TPA: protein translocase subunit SecD [Candidatus Babeliales bacterium]|nr:protein translocase subunit SecD [Candidatus Babeliales bacterium]
MNQSVQRIVSSPFMIWIAVAAIGLFAMMPLSKSLKRGIDLAGGTYITLSVQTDKAVQDLLGDKMDAILEKLKVAGKERPVKSDIVNNELVFTFSSTAAAQAAATQLGGFDRTIKYSSENDTMRVALTEREAERVKSAAVTKNIEVLSGRLSRLGLSEILIAAHGERNIVIELPGVADPQQAKAMIGTPAMLEFKLIEKAGKSPEEILLEHDGEMPSGMEIIPGAGTEEGTMYYLVPKRAAITGRYLKNASTELDERKSEWAVSFEFTSEGGQKFYELTSKNLKRTLGAILDGSVITAATIESAISNKGSISRRGGFDVVYAKELALLLKSGSFVAPVTFEEERLIGPTLGAESIRQGLLSCLLGLVLLFVFSVYYYSMSGLFAFIALLYNLVLIMIGLALFGAVLTLPGIGGMVLTVGMAIDASILIYERIKEELAMGTPIRKAVDNGFSDAMSVILDSNITTFIVGAVLFQFGTGPIQGFAVTLMLGIVSTLISGLFFLKSLFNFVLDNFSIQKLRI